MPAPLPAPLHIKLGSFVFSLVIDSLGSSYKAYSLLLLLLCDSVELWLMDEIVNICP